MYKSAQSLLEQSDLLKKLLNDNFQINGYELMNRLNELAEIPFTQNIPKVKKWLITLNELVACDDGFSLTKKSDYILPCYNGMLTSLFLKMGHSNESEIQKGINWIMQNQRFERNTETRWTGSGVKKYGGCLKSTPCYIGIVKSVIALSDYRKSTLYQFDKSVEAKFMQGVEYILSHNVYLRKSTEKPITDFITSLSYPYTWKTNIIEILRVLKSNNLIDDPRCNLAKEYLKSKRKEDQFWYPAGGYKPKGWIIFDETKKPGLWLSYEIEQLGIYLTS